MEPYYSISYIWKRVTIYPDLVKVKVALDNGEIVGRRFSLLSKPSY